MVTHLSACIAPIIYNNVNTTVTTPDSVTLTTSTVWTIIFVSAIASSVFAGIILGMLASLLHPILSDSPSKCFIHSFI
jgi:hypothetical protein